MAAVIGGKAAGPSSGFARAAPTPPLTHRKALISLTIMLRRHAALDVA